MQQTEIIEGIGMHSKKIDTMLENARKKCKTEAEADPQKEKKTHSVIRRLRRIIIGE